MSSQEQMPIVYPVSDTVPTSNHSSNGSYGTVFIVLAVIITLSAFACFLGRLFNKRQDVAKSSKHNLPTKEKHAMRSNVKDGDIEFGHDKRFASAKVATTGESTTNQTNPFGEPKMVRAANSFHEPTMGQGRPNSFQDPSRMGSSEPAMGRPAHDASSLVQEPYKVQGPNSFHEPAMGRPNDSFREPTMGRPSSFDHKGESQGVHEMRFDVNRDNKLNFIPRTRPQRY